MQQTAPLWHTASAGFAVAREASHRPPSRRKCDNPTRILTVGDTGAIIKNAFTKVLRRLPPLIWGRVPELALVAERTVFIRKFDVIIER
jgi:hypothetical protein